MIRVGDTFYMVSTSMHYVPGCPVIKSKDLVNWEMASYAVDRYDEDPRYDMQGGTLYLNGSWIPPYLVPPPRFRLKNDCMRAAHSSSSTPFSTIVLG